MILGTKATTSKSKKDLIKLLSVIGTLLNYHLQSLAPAMSILTHELLPPAINGALKLQRYIESVYNVHITAMSWAIWFQTVARSPPRRITTHSHDDMEVAWQQHLDMLLWDRMLFHPQPTLYTNSLLLLSLSIFVKCHEHMKIGFASTGTQMCQLHLFEHLNWKERVWSIFDVRWVKYQANDGTVIAGLPWVPCRAAICKRHSDTSKVHTTITRTRRGRSCLKDIYIYDLSHL